MSYTEASILTHFDSGLFVEQKQYYPQGAPGDISYHFVLDLEHGYGYTAGSRLHLYADDDRWALVAEKNGYFNRALRAEIELHYFGNCIDYPINKYPERSCISNVQRVILIDGDEWNRICNRAGDEDEQFELVDPGTEYVMIRDARVPFEPDVTKYRALGIEPRKFGNPRSLIGFEDLVRYYHDTDPEVLWATETEIRRHIPGDLRKLMIIDDFHFSSTYTDGHNLCQEEMYQLIARVIANRDPSLWKPTLPANNHWSNWESGNL